MFEKGEYVVYGSKGVCRIQEISQSMYTQGKMLMKAVKC